MISFVEFSDLSIFKMTYNDKLVQLLYVSYCLTASGVDFTYLLFFTFGIYFIIHYLLFLLFLYSLCLVSPLSGLEWLRIIYLATNIPPLWG